MGKTESLQKEEDCALDVDRISQLPDDLIHRILSFLPPQYAAQAPLLSKSWNHLCSTSPTLDFFLRYQSRDGSYSPNPKTIKPAEEKFLNVADNLVLRRLQQSLNPSKFLIYISFPYLNFLAPYMDRWVGIAVARNIQHIELQVPSNSVEDRYSVPQTLLSAKSLTVLKLSGVILKSECDIQLVQLRKLCLTNVHYSDAKMYQNLVLNCPSIEYLVLENCGLTSFRLAVGLLQLKEIHLMNCKQLSTIEFEAPNLHTFQSKKSPLCEINFPTVIALMNLILHDSIMTDEQFDNVISKLPILEVLELHGCSFLKRIRIPSQKLKRLITQCRELLDINIGSSNLVSIHHNSFKVPVISLSTWHLLKVHVEFWLESREIHELAKLKDILLKSSYSEDFKFVVYCVEEKMMMIHEKLNEVQLSPLLNLKYQSTRMSICISSMSCADLLNEMLWQRMPETLSVVCSSNTLTEEFPLVKSLDGIGAEDHVRPEWKFFLKSHSTAQYQRTTIWNYERLSSSRSNRSRYESSVWDNLSKL